MNLLRPREGRGGFIYPLGADIIFWRHPYKSSGKVYNRGLPRRNACSRALDLDEKLFQQAVMEEALAPARLLVIPRPIQGGKTADPGRI